MNFGFSVGDCVAVVGLVRTAYKAWNRACGEYSYITRSLDSLLIGLERIEEEAQRSDSILMRTARDRADLFDVLSGIERTVRELDQILRSYSSLERSRRNNWKRLQFGTKDLDVWRTKLSDHNTALATYLSTVGTASLTRVERDLQSLPEQIHAMIGRLTEETQAGRRENGEAFERIEGEALPNLQTSVDQIPERLLALINSHAEDIRAGRREGSIMTTYEDDEKEVWRQFRRELIGNGMKSAFVDKYRPQIMSYLQQLAEQGELEERSIQGSEDDADEKDLRTDFDVDLSSTSASEHGDIPEHCTNPAVATADQESEDEASRVVEKTQSTGKRSAAIVPVRPVSTATASESAEAQGQSPSHQLDHDIGKESLGSSQSGRTQLPSKALSPAQAMWICTASYSQSVSGIRLQKDIGKCKTCMRITEYEDEFDAADHLRRRHFFAEGAENRVSFSRDNRSPLPSLEELKSEGFVTRLEQAEIQRALDLRTDLREKNSIRWQAKPVSIYCPSAERLQQKLSVQSHDPDQASKAVLCPVCLLHISEQEHLMWPVVRVDRSLYLMSHTIDRRFACVFCHRDRKACKTCGSYSIWKRGSVRRMVVDKVITGTWGRTYHYGTVDELAEHLALRHASEMVEKGYLPENFYDWSESGSGSGSESETK